MHPTNLNSFLFLQALLLTLYFLPVLAAVTAEVNHLKGEPCEQIHPPISLYLLFCSSTSCKSSENTILNEEKN